MHYTYMSREYRDRGKVGITTEMKNDFDLMISLIRNRDKTSLVKLLNNKSVNILNISNDGWFALHEAVDLGYTDIVKLIIKFATQNGIKVLEMWDLTAVCCRKYCCVAFNELISFPYNVSLIPTKQQTSFLRLAVQSHHIKLINIFIKLYKNLSNRTVARYKRREISESDFLSELRRFFGKIRPNHAGVLEAIFESITQTEVLHILLNAFPEFLEYHGGKLVSGVMQMAINQNKLESVSLIFSLLFNLLRSKKTARMQKKCSIVECVLIVMNRCAEWSCKNNDLTVLRLLVDAAGGKDLVINSHNCAIILLDEKSCGMYAGLLDTSHWKATNNYDCCVLYYLLYYFCHYGSVNLVRFLVKLGLDVYEDCLEIDFPFLHDLRNLKYNFLNFELAWSKRFFQIQSSFQCFSFPFSKMYETKIISPQLWCNRNNVLTIFWAAINSNIDVLKYLLTIVEKQQFYKIYHHCYSKLYINVAIHMQFESLHILLKAGFHIETFCPEQGTHFLSNLLIIHQAASVNTLRILVNYGAVEFMFGCHNSTAPFKQYLINIWNKIAQRMQGLEDYHAEQHENSQTRKVEMLICVEKFDVLLNHLGLLMFTGDHGYYIEQAVPTMKQLCRYVIRCRIIKKCKTLQYVYELPIPASLKSYLCHN